MTLSNKIQSLEGSKTVAFTALIQDLRRKGKEVIDLAVGEPEFDTPSAVIQSTKAALDARWLATRQAEMQHKRDFAYRYASQFFRCIKPQGAFYLFPDVSTVLKPGETAQVLTERFLKEAGVAVVAGEVFGVAKHIRISFAVPEDKLIKGFEQIAEAL